MPLFLRFGGLDYSRPTAATRLDTYIRWVQGILAAYGGSLLQITVGDKGTCLYAAFGVPVAHSDAAARAARRRPGAADPAARLPLYRRRADWAGERAGLRRPLRQPGQLYLRGAGYLRKPGRTADGRRRTRQHPGNTRCAPGGGFRVTWTALPPLLVKGEAAPVPVYGLIGGLHPIRRWVGRPRWSGGPPNSPMCKRCWRERGPGTGKWWALLGRPGWASRGWWRQSCPARRRAEGGDCLPIRGRPSYGVASPYWAWQRVWRAFFDLDPTGTPAEQARELEARLAEIARPCCRACRCWDRPGACTLPETDLTVSMEPALRTAVARGAVDRLPAGAGDHDAGTARAGGRPLAGCALARTAGGGGAGHSGGPAAVLLAYRPPELEHCRRPAGSRRCRTSRRCTWAGWRRTTRRRWWRRGWPNRAGRSRRGSGLPAWWRGRRATRSTWRNWWPTHGSRVWIRRTRRRGRGWPGRPACIASAGAPRPAHRTRPPGAEGRQRDRGALPGGPLMGRASRSGRGGAGHGRPVGLGRGGVGALPEGAAEPAYRFKHAVTQEVTYGTLPGAVRAGLHGQFAAWLEAAGATTVELLAYHYGRSSNEEKAREYLRRAGETAAAGGAFAAAAGHYSALLERLDAADPARGAYWWHGERRGWCWERGPRRERITRRHGRWRAHRAPCERRRRAGWARCGAGKGPTTRRSAGWRRLRGSMRR